MYTFIKKLLPYWLLAHSRAHKLLSAALIFNALSFQLSSILPPDTFLPIANLETNVALTSLYDQRPLVIADRLTVTLTAYSSTPDQTDDTPFTTASNTQVRDGIVAANFLPFGTKIMIPELFGDKVFVVEDRMHRRFSDRVDVWFEHRETAVKFGIQEAEILVIAS